MSPRAYHDDSRTELFPQEKRKIESFLARIVSRDDASSMKTLVLSDRQKRFLIGRGRKYKDRWLVQYRVTTYFSMTCSSNDWVTRTIELRKL